MIIKIVANIYVHCLFMFINVIIMLLAKPHANDSTMGLT